MRTRASIVLLCALGCGDPELTEILVVADTDLEVPGALSGVRFRVVGPNGDEQAAVADFAAGDPRPAMLALVHRGGPLGPFVVEVIGEGVGDVVVARTAEVSFAPNEVLVLSMHLLASCVSSTCAEDETCGERGCRPRAVERHELTAWTGDPPPLDVPDGGAMCATDCDDGVECTVDRCASDGECAHVPSSASCDDGVACTRDVCDPIDGCSSIREDAACDDEVECTADRCDPIDGCANVPSSASCDDGIACTIESCDPIAGCASTPDARACDDGIPCTIDRCDGLSGCTHEPDDGVCDDGTDCTMDACDAALGCTSRTAAGSCPPGQWCDRAARSCARGASFTEVYSFLAGSCVGSCHGAGDALDLSSRASAYLALVGADSVCDASARVIPFDARGSLLWRKVARVDLCGSRMPPSGAPVRESDVALLESWIASGALDD
jgi:hypothetical protein